MRSWPGQPPRSETGARHDRVEHVHIVRIGFTCLKGGRHTTHDLVDLTADGPAGDRMFCLVNRSGGRVLRTVENPALLRAVARWHDGVLSVDLQGHTIEGKPSLSGETLTVDYWGRTAVWPRTNPTGCKPLGRARTVSWCRRADNARRVTSAKAQKPGLSSPNRLAHSGCRVTPLPSTNVDGGAQNRRSGLVAYSHSIVPGGLLVTSSTTRLTSGTSLVIRVEILARTSYGTRVQSAVIASSEETGRNTIG